MADTPPLFDWLNPFDTLNFPMEEWAGVIKEWAFEARPSVRPWREPLDWLVNNTEYMLQNSPQLIVLLVLALLGWQAGGRRVGLIVLGVMSLLGMMGDRSWDLAMTTLAVVVSAVVICVLIGFPLGVISGKSDRAETLLRPVLDTMQTIPGFVYLLPVVILWGIGNSPGIVVTVIFAMPPIIRLTALGIRQVNAHVVEAMRAFGATPRQILVKVEIPLAMPSIMAGLNQTILLALSMVVIASMISVKGLGLEVLQAIGRMDVGKGIIGGLGIVILAMVLDRITQGLGRSVRERGCRHWYEQGPVGLMLRLLPGKKLTADGKQM